MAKRKRKRKNPALKGVKFPTLQQMEADPVLMSAVMDFFTGFVRLQQALQDRTSFTPASEEDRARERKDASWPDPRRTAARRPRNDEDDGEEEAE